MTGPGKTEYRDLLLSLLPPGQMARGPESNMARAMDATAAELARIHALALLLVEEADPRTTMALFEDWEAFAGLPDPCAPSDMTVGERRDRLIQKLKERGDPSRAYFIALAAELGYDITIEEFRTMEFGAWGFGHHVEANPFGFYTIGPFAAGSAYEHYWNVYVHGPRLTRFAFGRASFPDPMLQIRAAEDLECVLRRLMPADTHLTFIYEEEMP